MPLHYTMEQSPNRMDVLLMIFMHQTSTDRSVKNWISGRTSPASARGLEFDSGGKVTSKKYGKVAWRRGRDGTGRQTSDYFFCTIQEGAGRNEILDMPALFGDPRSQVILSPKQAHR